MSIVINIFSLDVLSVSRSGSCLHAAKIKKPDNDLQTFLLTLGRKIPNRKGSACLLIDASKHTLAA